MTDSLYVQHQANAVPMIPENTIFDKFVLKRMIGGGGYGQVFEAHTIRKEHEKSVVKVEAQTAEFQLLYNECQCLRGLNARYNYENLPDAKPFLRFYGYGEIDGFRWLAMEKCGKNLCDLRASVTLNRFSVGTSLFILSKLIEALKMMHNIGWLHLDVTPSNISISLTSRRHLYLLGFGMSRFYMEQDGSLKAVRMSAPNRRKVKYVSINVHRRQDVSRWDDFWSTFYIATENMVGKLPWNDLSDEKLVENSKASANLGQLHYSQEKVRPKSLIAMESSLTKVLSNPSHASQFSPPYKEILSEIESDLRLCGFTLSTVPLDWMMISRVDFEISSPDIKIRSPVNRNSAEDPKN